MKTTPVTFRPMNLDDLGNVAAWLANFEDIALFDRCLPIPVSDLQVEGSWKPAIEHKEPPDAMWYMAEQPDQSLIGMCGLQKINYIHGDGIIPVFVDRAHRGKGLGLVMLNAIFSLAFRQLRLHRVSTVFRADNDVSQKLIKSAGFVEEGRLREAWFANDTYHDVIQVGMLKSEWQKKQDTLEKRLLKSQYRIENNCL